MNTSPNMIILAIGFLFSLIENSFFGWNWKPQSEAELICDGICAIIFALAYVGHS